MAEVETVLNISLALFASWDLGFGTGKISQRKETTDTHTNTQITLYDVINLMTSAPWTVILSTGCDVRTALCITGLNLLHDRLLYRLDTKRVLDDQIKKIFCLQRFKEFLFLSLDKQCHYTVVTK